MFVAASPSAVSSLGEPSYPVRELPWEQGFIITQKVLFKRWNVCNCTTVLFPEQLGAFTLH